MSFFSVYADERFWCWYFQFSSECTFSSCMLIWCTNFQPVSVITFIAMTLKRSWFMIFNPYDVAIDRKETSIKGTYSCQKFWILRNGRHSPQLPYQHVAKYYEEPSGASCPSSRNSHSVIRKLRFKFRCHWNYVYYYRYIFNNINELLHFVCRKVTVLARIIL